MNRGEWDGLSWGIMYRQVRLPFYGEEKVDYLIKK